MNADLDLAHLKFGIGQPVSRKEDPMLLRGEGRYTDDLSLPGQAYRRDGAQPPRAWQAAPDRHRGRALDARRARHLYRCRPGGVPASARCPSACTQKNRDGTPMRIAPQPPLATDRVRYVGDPVAMVVAETEEQARDAAEEVSPRHRSAARRHHARPTPSPPGAPTIHDEAPDNVALDFHYGDTEAVAAAFAAAAHVTRLRIRNNRIVVCPMEPRSAIGEYDPESGRWTLRVGCQGVFGLRNSLAHRVNVPVEKMRVLTGNVGGSFGMKAGALSRVFPAAARGARCSGRPVKWTDARSESFLSDSHGRDHDMEQRAGARCRGAFPRAAHQRATAISAPIPGTPRSSRPRSTR